MHQRGLLDVLLPEDRHVGLHDVEELGHDREDAGEVPRTHRAFPPRGERARRHRHVTSAGVHLVHRRHEEEIHAARLGLRRVAGNVARIAIEVLPRSELERIDEDAHHHALGASARLVDEPKVSFVKKAHGGHERHAIAGLPARRDRLTERGDPLDRAHPRSCARHRGSAPAAPRRRIARRRGAPGRQGCRSA